MSCSSICNCNQKKVLCVLKAVRRRHSHLYLPMLCKQSFTLGIVNIMSLDQDEDHKLLGSKRIRIRRDSQKSETQTRTEMKGWDRGLNNHRSLSLSWNERCFRKMAFSSLSCFSPLVKHRRGVVACGLNGWTKVISLAVAS